MKLILWFLEFLIGAYFLYWAIPKVLGLARMVRQIKRSTALPKYDTGEYLPWLGFEIGIILSFILFATLHTFHLVNFIVLATLLSSLGAYFAEWLSQHTLPEKHPWRVIVEEMAAHMGIEPGEIRYRVCPQSAPYASLGGITLTSKALRSLDDAALRFTIVGALAARQSGKDWTRLILWLLAWLAAYSVYFVGPFLERSQAFFSFERTLPYQMITISLMFSLVRKVPIYVRAKDNFKLDCEALTHTGDFEAACRAIYKTDTSERAQRRIRELRFWWEKHQHELAAMKAGTPAALQSSNTQVLTIGQKQ